MIDQFQRKLVTQKTTMSYSTFSSSPLIEYTSLSDRSTLSDPANPNQSMPLIPPLHRQSPMFTSFAQFSKPLSQIVYFFFSFLPQPVISPPDESAPSSSFPQTNCPRGLRSELAPALSGEKLLFYSAPPPLFSVCV